MFHHVISFTYHMERVALPSPSRCSTNFLSSTTTSTQPPRNLPTSTKTHGRTYLRVSRKREFHYYADHAVAPSLPLQERSTMNLEV